ncbi:hypothetical protein [Sorangium sp. So ce861]|uniref:hypothetical protein n=1 Tax=Sorangium sp. So ce861 TaxID=3133323 RepID=UPI003F62C5BB
MTTHVGTLLQPVKPGHTVTIDGAYQRMPAVLRSVQVRGFTSVRYTAKNFHTLNTAQLRTELGASGVIVYYQVLHIYQLGGTMPRYYLENPKKKGDILVQKGQSWDERVGKRSRIAARRSGAQQTERVGPRAS